MTTYEGAKQAPIEQRVAQRVTVFRKELGLSFESLSKMMPDCGRISPIGLRRLEKGVRHITVDELFALANVLRTDILKLTQDDTKTVHNIKTSESNFEQKSAGKHLDGLYGFDLVAPHEDDKTLLCPGRVYRVQANVDGSLYLIEFFESSYGSVGDSLGMSLRDLSDLIDPHFFQSKKEMLREYRSWVKDYDFWAERRLKRLESADRMEVDHADS